MLNSPERILDEVAAAVADGDQIDWPEVYRRLDGSDSTNVAAALQEIDGLGRESRSMSIRLEPNRKVHPFLLLMIPALVLQVSAGAIAYFIGPGMSSPVPGWLLVLAAVVFAAAGVVVAIAGRWDPRTAPLAGLFLSIASGPAVASTSFMAPGLVRSATAAPLFEAFLPFFFWWFVEGFPRLVRLERRGRWIVWAKGVSLAVGVGFFLVNLVDGLLPNGFLQPEIAYFVLRSPTGGYWLTLFALVLPAPFVIFARLRHAQGEERRRAKLFMVGLAIGILPMIVAVLAVILIPSVVTGLSSPRWRVVVSFVLYGFMFTIPITLGHAAVARRALDLRFALGRAGRAVLARGFLWTLAVGPWPILAALLWLGRERSLSELFQRPVVPALVGIGLVGVGLILARDRLLAGLDRRISGAKGLPGAVFALFAQRLSTVRDNEELAELVRQEAPGLIHAESCFLLVWSEMNQQHVSIHNECGHLDEESALARLAAASPSPISLDERESDSWIHLLPEVDRLWAMDADLRLLLPIEDRGGGCVGLMVFGPSTSGFPFSAVQRDTATAAASSVSLSLTRLGSAEGTSLVSAASLDEPAGECVSCGRMAEAAGDDCPCGGVFRSAVIPPVLNGKFTLERVLGRGGMGVVYLGRDLELDRLVALKTLPRMRSGSLMRLRREARSMASFVHPNLALIFGAETWRGVPVLVVEYLSGGTLSGRIDGGNEPVFVAELGIKLTGALSALHRKGLLHRDVKPANIGLSEQGEPKLLDFGLAQIIEETQSDFGGMMGQTIRLGGTQPPSARLTETSHVVGTPLYLSPEILAGEEPSPEQDLWALHLVLWEVLAGRHPLQGLELEVALDHLRNREIPSVRTVCPACPEPLAEFLDRGLSRRKLTRKPTADLVQKDLRSLVSELEAI